MKAYLDQVDITDYQLLKIGHQCLSKDIYLSSSNNNDTAMTATDCAILCKRRVGCKYFIFLQRSVIEEYFNCYWEDTSDASCPEGWTESKFDFYQIRGVF